MNYRAIIRMLGLILAMEGGLMALPMAISIGYGESCVGAFVLSIGIIEFAAALLLRLKPSEKDIYAVEGFAIVAASWITLSVFGALPFWLSGEIPAYVDALFETVSGFTTTGSTILTSPQDMSCGLLFWRSFTHWIGGMGILVFAMAVLPMAHDRSMHVMRAEVPGPQVSKLVPRTRESAGVLYGIYTGITLLQVWLLYLGGMPVYDCFITAFGTAGTGGFSNLNASIAGYHSAYVEVVVTIFMLLFGVNFNLYFLLLRRNLKGCFKNEELRWYLMIVAVATLLITLNIMGQYEDILDALRYSAFQVASVITTTGFATYDYELWPMFSKLILFLLMFVGACAGSTGGGIKVSRLIIMVKKVFADVVRMAHPHSVRAVHVDDKLQDVTVVHRASQFFVAYILIIFIGALLIALDDFDFETTLTAALTCISNVGPGLGRVIGPTGNFSAFSPMSKIVMSLLMLLGRLEIFPILLFCNASMYTHKRHKTSLSIDKRK